ncbi:hypothetical protein Q1695_010558 [Nippostrongylus brasiliensis]|nr:hypothetical protein Q1695_010558 [Nippostrongylus brasiliensis]
MLGRSDGSSSSSEASDRGTQFATQSGGTKVSIDKFVDRFIDHSKKLAAKRKSGNLDEKFVTNVRIVVRQVAEEHRRERVFSFLRSTVETDQAAKVTEFYIAWCQLTSLLDDDEQSSCRLAGLRLALEVLCTHPLFALYVSGLYDQFLKQTELCDSGQIKSLLETHAETLKMLDLSSWWTDCTLVLLNHLLKNEEITNDGQVISSKSYVRELVYDWMIQAATSDVFGAVVLVLQNLSMDDLIEKFLEESASEEILFEEQRPLLTRKCINLTRIVNGKRLPSLLREIVAAWLKKSGVPPALELVSCVHQMVKVVESHQNIGKAWCAMFKSEPGFIMCSEFGFLVTLGLCKIDRYKAATITELTKAFQRLWNFRENVNEFGWIENSGLGEVVDVVEDQVTCLVQRIGEDLEALELLSEPLVQLLRSLLRLPSTKEVTIVDGRVADGCPLWLFASKVLVKLIITRRKELGTHLAMILESISTSSASLALVHVDMLVDIIRNCTLDVLNNWRELEGLFKNICQIQRDVAVSLIRCLMPVINNRSQLREQLLQSVKGNLLDSRRATAVIPILMLLFRSFSRRPQAVSGSQMSQSFATFSSQSLQAMGCKRKADETVCLEVIGLLKRCLTQWTPTKKAVYLGFAEEGTRNSAMTGQCLDLLVCHAATAPEWKADAMVVSAGGAVTLVEPMPQLVQAMQCLLSEEVVADAARTQTQIGVNVQTSANTLIDSWVLKASSEDVHDLGVDKLSEWNPATPVGSANLLFARMMLNLYDVLVEHVWSQFMEKHSLTSVDRIVALLGRRKELDEVLQEKYVRRKEVKVGTNEAGPSLDLKQADILINGRTLSQILENTVPEESSSTDVLNDVNCELLDWAIDRVVSLSQSLLDGFHPLHSMLCGSSTMITIAGYLLDYYTGTNCANWIESREISSPSKTKALEAYSNIIQYMSTKYRSQPTKILAIWKQSDLNATLSKGGEKTLTTNGSLVRHCHMFMTKLLPAVLTKDRREGEEKKRIGLELERQAKFMFKICASLMRIMDNPKCYMTMFKFTIGVLEKNTVENNATLRELLKWLCTLAMKCTDTDHAVERALNTIADDLVQVLSEDGDQCKYSFVEAASQATICDFLASSIDNSLVAVRAVISFAGAFQAKDQRMDEVLSAALNKCDHCCELTSRLLPLHSQFAVQKERLVQTLTTLFSAVQEPVDLMLSNVKSVPEMIEWKSLSILSKLLKERLQAIMAVADEHVGIFNPEEVKDSRKKKNVKRDEVIYVKYVRAREALQSRLLMVSEALKEERLNFQVKKNTIGMRDFRINVNTLKTRVEQNESDDQPRKKKRRATQSMGGGDEQENEEDATRTTPIGVEKMAMDTIFDFDNQNYVSEVISFRQFFEEAVRSRILLNNSGIREGDENCWSTDLFRPYRHVFPITGDDVRTSKRLVDSLISDLRHPTRQYNFNKDDGRGQMAVPKDARLQCMRVLLMEHESRRNPQYCSIVLRTMQYDRFHTAVICHSARKRSTALVKEEESTDGFSDTTQPVVTTESDPSPPALPPNQEEQKLILNGGGPYPPPNPQLTTNSFHYDLCSAPIFNDFSQAPSTSSASFGVFDRSPPELMPTNEMMDGTQVDMKFENPIYDSYPCSSPNGKVDDISDPLTNNPWYSDYEPGSYYGTDYFSGTEWDPISSSIPFMDEANCEDAYGYQDVGQGSPLIKEEVEDYYEYGQATHNYLDIPHHQQYIEEENNRLDEGRADNSYFFANASQQTTAAPESGTALIKKEVEVGDQYEQPAQHLLDISHQQQGIPAKISRLDESCAGADSCMPSPNDSQQSVVAPEPASAPIKKKIEDDYEYEQATQNCSNVPDQQRAEVDGVKQLPSDSQQTVTAPGPSTAVIKMEVADDYEYEQVTQNCSDTSHQQHCTPAKIGRLDVSCTGADDFKPFLNDSQQIVAAPELCTAVITKEVEDDCEYEEATQNFVDIAQQQQGKPEKMDENCVDVDGCKPFPSDCQQTVAESGSESALVKKVDEACKKQTTAAAGPGTSVIKKEVEDDNEYGQATQNSVLTSHQLQGKSEKISRSDESCVSANGFKPSGDSHQGVAAPGGSTAVIKEEVKDDHEYRQATQNQQQQQVGPAKGESTADVTPPRSGTAVIKKEMNMGRRPKISISSRIDQQRERAPQVWQHQDQDTAVMESEAEDGFEYQHTEQQQAMMSNSANPSPQQQEIMQRNHLGESTADVIVSRSGTAVIKKEVEDDYEYGQATQNQQQQDRPAEGESTASVAAPGSGTAVMESEAEDEYEYQHVEQQQPMTSNSANPSPQQQETMEPNHLGEITADVAAPESGTAVIKQEVEDEYRQAVQEMMDVSQQQQVKPSRFSGLEEILACVAAPEPSTAPIKQEIEDRDQHATQHQPTATNPTDPFPQQQETLMEPDHLNDIVVMASVHLGYPRPLERHEIRLGRLMKVLDRFLILGSNTLKDLKNVIECSSDNHVFEDVSGRPVTNEDFCKNRYPSSFFFFHDTFYIDLEPVGAKDITRETREWLADRGFGETKVAYMNTTRIIDLKCRLGAPYLYVHVGGCEHLISFNNIALRDEHHPVGSYPFPIYERNSRRIACAGCKELTAEWLVWNHEAIPTPVEFFCDDCYKDFNYDVNGRKIFTFNAAPLYGRRNRRTDLADPANDTPMKSEPSTSSTSGDMSLTD